MKKIKIGDAEVAVKGTASGDRPALFAVHMAGAGAWLWKDLRAELAEFADLYAIELPGRGSSTGTGSDCIETYREIVRQAAREMGLERTIAIGHSMGGAIVLDWAVSHPEELSGIVLLSTGAKLKVHPMIFEAIEKNFEGYISIIGKMGFGPKADEEVVEIVQEALARTKPEIHAGDFRACNSFDIREKIGDLIIPALVLCGSEDALTPVKYSEYLAEKIQGSKLKVFQGAGHMLPVERPESVADFIRRFVMSIAES